jgi:AcrR family transcriptional regulator
VSKRAIQRERTRRYFIDAAKEIVKSQGLEQVSARNVADLAGYSYATIYNYFNDINDLLWHVTVDLLREMGQALNQIQLQGDDPVEWLKQGYRAYIRYYLEYPAVFRFLFHSQIGQPTPEVMAILQSNLVGTPQEQVLQECVSRGLMVVEDIPVVASMLVNLVHGLLALHFAAVQQITREQLFVGMEMYVDFLLRKLQAAGNERIGGKDQ